MYRKTYHDSEEIYLHLFLPRMASDFPEVEETSSRAARYLFPGDHLSTLSSPPTGEVLFENAEPLSEMAELCHQNADLLSLKTQSCAIKTHSCSLWKRRAMPSKCRSTLSMKLQRKNAPLFPR